MFIAFVNYYSKKHRKKHEFGDCFMISLKPREGIATKGTNGTAVGPFSIQVCALEKLTKGMRIPAS